MDEHSQAEESRPAKPRIVAALGLFLVGFVLTAAILHETVRTPLRLYADIRSEKLAIMDAWQGKVLSAAFGSSHVHNGFDPRAFDAALAGTALETHSLNGGVSGGSQTEQRRMALEFLRQLRAPQPDGPPQACFLILEITAGANFTNDHLVHPRAINIYDWKTLRFVSSLTEAGMGLKQRVGRVGYAAAATLMHYLNVGLVSSTIFSPPLDQAILEREAAHDRRGLEPGQPLTAAQEHDIVEDFAHARAAKPAAPVPEPLLPGNYGLLQELDQASPVKNMQELYVVMPMISDIEQRRAYPAEMVGPHGPEPILNLAQPDLYPELFVPKYWADDSHLNEAGAALASRYLAEQVKAWYGANPSAVQCGPASDRKRGG